MTSMGKTTGPGRGGRALRVLAGAAATLPSMAALAQAAGKPIEGPSLAPMILALVVVLGLMAVAVWILRRTGIAPRAGSGYLRVVTQLPLGPRERVVIVEAGDRWLLLGVGAAGITRLGNLPKSETPTAPATPPNFSALLDRLRGGTR